MGGAAFDRFTRVLGTRLSRRGTMLAAGMAALGGGRAVSANQLTPATCGASGEVCTMLMGCCDGLTCVTSAINVNYGVCVAGEGGTVSIGTTLISPFSENVEQEVAAIAASDTASTTTATDPTLEREQRLAEIKARKDARRSEQKTRRTTKQTEQQDRRETQQFNRDQRRGPELSLSISRSRSSGDAELVRIINRDDTSAFISKVEILPERRERHSISETVQAGNSVFLVSGVANDEVLQEDEVFLSTLAACENSVDGTGYAISAGFSEFTDMREYIILCDGSVPIGSAGGRGSRKKKRRQNSNKNKN